MIIKVIGLLLLVAAGAFLGFSAAAGLSRRAAALEKIQRLLIQLGSQIRYTAAPVGELLAAAAASPEFQSLPFLKAAAADLQIDGDFHTAWRQGVKEQGEASGLTAADRELLVHFGDGLGRTDVEGQLTNCRLYAEQLGERLEEARRDAATKSRLYVTLGVTGGIGLALLLL